MVSLDGVGISEKWSRCHWGFSRLKGVLGKGRLKSCCTRIGKEVVVTLGEEFVSERLRREGIKKGKNQLQNCYPSC